MKKFLAIMVIAAIAFAVPNRAQAQVQGSDDYAAYLGALDTLTNTDTATYVVSIKGAKHCISIGDNVTKISGTVASSIKVYGSIDGVTYLPTALTTVTVTDASVNYGIVYTNNAYQKYKIQLITAGTQSFSHRPYLMYRKLP